MGREHSTVASLMLHTIALQANLQTAMLVGPKKQTQVARVEGTWLLTSTSMMQVMGQYLCCMVYLFFDEFNALLPVAVYANYNSVA